MAQSPGVGSESVVGEHRVLSVRTIALWSAGVLILAGLAAMLLLWQLGGGTPQDSAKLDALRTAANIVVGTGGAAALLLAARRQRSAELDLVQKDHDATERRITEIYSKAADQLGSDKAPVRLAGLYALERLAQDYEPQRQTIVNVICAYLRMPFRVSAARAAWWSHDRCGGSLTDLAPRRPPDRRAPGAPSGVRVNRPGGLYR